MGPTHNCLYSLPAGARFAPVRRLLCLPAVAASPRVRPLATAAAHVAAAACHRCCCLPLPLLPATALSVLLPLIGSSRVQGKRGRKKIDTVVWIPFVIVKEVAARKDCC